MPTLDAILDAFETILRSSQSALAGGLEALPAGAEGIERKLGRGEDLTPGQLPHVYLHDASSVRNRVEGGSIERVLTVQAEMWVEREILEQAWARVEALDATLEADATLGGLVTDALVVDVTTERYDVRARSKVPFALAVRWLEAPAPGVSTVADTPRTVLGTIAAAVESLTGATALPAELVELVELGGDVVPGTRRYQLAALPAGYRKRGSNTGRPRLRCRLRVLTALHGDDLERGYTWGTMQGEMGSLVNREWWVALAGVREVLEGPDVELERPGGGRVVVYTVEVDLDVDEGV